MQKPNKTVRRIIIAIIWVCMVVGLSSYKNRNAKQSAESDPFLLSHTLDPSNGPDRYYQRWDAAQWIKWLNRRETLHRRATDEHKISRRFPLNEKRLNTVVIATPAEITAAFAGPLDKFRSELVWSNRDFTSYDFVRTHTGTYLVYRCPPGFIAVKLINNKPVHLGDFSPVKIRNGNTNFSRPKKCIKLN